MAGRKLGSKASEEVEFMEHLLRELGPLGRKVEEYASAKKGADAVCQQITRTLSQFRQQAMMKNLGPLADQAGALAVQCARGSQVMRTRTMRDGLASFKVMLDRVIKARIDQDVREQGEKATAMEHTRAEEKAHQAGVAAKPAGSGD